MGALRFLRRYCNRRLLSLGLFQAWIFMVFHSSQIIQLHAQTFGIVYSGTLAFSVLTLVVGTLINYHRHSRIYFLVFGALSGSCATAAMFFLPIGESGLLVCSLLLGVGTGMFIPFVGKVYCSTDLDQATQQTFLSFAFAAALYFALQVLDATVRALAISLLPLALTAVILSLVFVSHQAQRPHHLPGKRDEVREIVRSRPLVMFFFGVALLGIAFGYSLALCSSLDTPVFNQANSWAVLSTGILAIVYFIVVRRPGRTYSFQGYFSPVAPIIIIGLLALPFSTSAAVVLIITGFQLADMAIWNVFVWIGRHSGLPQRVFCIGKSSMYAGMLIGSLVQSLIPQGLGPDTLPSLVASILAYLLVLATVFIFSNSRVNLAIRSASHSDDGRYIMRFIELRCEDLGNRFGLTTREKQILGYLAQGRSLPYIEEKLHISHSTANSHRDHIYAKMGIHSRKELLDPFFGSGE
jgi:DNA-binding CsgD family transcriptional regulator